MVETGRILPRNPAPIFYFLRHGETGFNAEQRTQGQLDVPLNDTGRAQVERNGRALRTVLGDPEAFHYVSSPLCRATETMEILRRELGLPAAGYATDDRLREIHMGRWQGTLWHETGHADADLRSARHRDPWSICAPGEGGESYEMLNARVLAWLAEADRHTVVVAHGGPMRCIRGHVQRLDPQAIIGLDAPQDKVLRIDGAALSWV